MVEETVRPYDITSAAGGALTIAIRKEFDSGNLHQDWAQSILTMYPGPFTTVRIELSKCGLVSSTFFAGLVQLHFALNADGTKPLVLVKPDPRLVRNLTMLQLNTLFSIEPR